MKLCYPYIKPFSIKIKSIVFLCGWLACTPLSSQEVDSLALKTDEYGFKTSGSLDIYYRLGSTEAPTQTFLILEDKKIGIGSLNYLITYDHKRLGGLLHLAAGPRSEQFYNADENKILKHIRQSYLYYNVNKDIKLYAGTQTAMPGYEYDEPNLNPLYSTSYLNTLTPAIYTGIWATYQINDRWNMMLGIFNDTDRRIDKTKGKSIGSMLSYEKGDFKASLSNFSGREAYGLISVTDLLMDYNITQKHKISCEVLYNFINSDDINNSFYGANLYYTYMINKQKSFNLRAEYFNDKNGFGYDVKENSIYGITAGVKYIIFKRIVLMPEFRYDKATKNTFITDDGGLDQKSVSLIIGVSYVWD